jgi:GYF domain 2
MADKWYFAWDKQKFGPFSPVQLKELATLGRLQPKDLVWKNDIEKGVAADKVKHLFPDPGGTILPARDALAVTNDACSILGEAANTVQVPASINRPARPDGQQPVIPDGVSLRAIRDHCEETPVVSPPPINSSGPQTNDERAPETSPDLTSTADEKPQIPRVANKPADSPKKRPGKGRATAVKGAVIISQDGEYAKYRKKCTHCGHDDSCTRVIPITNGATRDTFFCTKCRKKREVVIQGKK